MPEEIEQRLAPAAQAAREHDLCQQQHAQLSDRVRAAAADLEAARYRVAQAQQRLDAAWAELEQLEQRQEQLAGARRAYADVLAAKEQYLTRSADPRGARLLALGEERGRLTAELTELRRASSDADLAAQALAEVQDRLGNAANWSTFDTSADTYASDYAVRGMFASGIEHNRIDWAAQAARTADERLAALRTDLSDIGGFQPTAPSLEGSAGFKFTDIFLNNVSTYLAAGQQMRAALDKAGQSAQQVSALQDQLGGQIRTLTRRLDALDAERKQLLTP